MNLRVDQFKMSKDWWEKNNIKHYHTINQKNKQLKLLVSKNRWVLRKAEVYKAFAYQKVNKVSLS